MTEKESSIYVFENLEVAIYKLENFGNSFRFTLNSFDKDEIIKNCVTSNIFRAFQLKENKPSKLFRFWADNEFNIILDNLGSIDSQNDFDKFVLITTNSLLDYWTKNVCDLNEQLIFGPAIKMVNLLIKMLQESTKFRNEKIIKFQNVPFDLYSLKPLTIIINEITSLNYKISIPSNVSMKYINCPEIYWIFMDAIRKLTKMSKISPIIYDYWSWNDKH